MVLLNIGGIGFITVISFRKTLESERLNTICDHYDVDMVCQIETNKDWRTVNQSNNSVNNTGTSS